MRTFECLRCSRKVQAHDSVYTLVCGCGQQLLLAGMVQPKAREILPFCVKNPGGSVYGQQERGA